MYNLSNSVYSDKSSLKAGPWFAQASIISYIHLVRGQGTLEV